MQPSIYRNKPNNAAIIQAIGTMRITTPQEAVAFLRAEQSVHAQIAGVLQRVSLSAQQAINRSLAHPIPVSTPVQPETPAPQAKDFEPENLSSEEGFSEADAKTRVAQLKKAKSNTKESKKDSKENLEA